MTVLGDQNYKFRGGLRIGILYNNTWPFGLLEVNPNLLTLRDEMFEREYKFSKADIVRIEIKKVFSIGYGIRIYHTNKSYNKKICFWYSSFRFQKLINALKESGWLT